MGPAMSPDATTAVLAAFLLVLIFLTRSLYRFINPHDIGRDAYGHLCLTRDIRDAGHRIPERPSKAATEGKYLYPLLIHWLLSFLPTRRVKTVERYFSGLMDVALASLILLLGFTGVLDSTEVLVALAIFLATPEFMRPNLSHGLGLSGRKPGLFFVTVCFLALSAWIATGSSLDPMGVGLFSLSVLAAAAVIMSSKFGLQAMFFISLGFLLLTPLSIMVVVAGALVAGVATKGFGFDLIRGHLVFLYDYATRKQFQIEEADPSVKLFVDPREVGSLRDLMEQIYESNLARPIMNNLFMVGVAAAYWYSYSSGDFPALPPGFHLWIAAGVGAFVLTSLPYLRFLGQAERYLEYVYLPALVLLARAWNLHGMEYRLVLTLVFLGGIVTIPVYIWAYRNEFYDPEDSRCFTEVLERLDKEDRGTVLVQPIWKGRAVAYETPHDVVDQILNGGSTEESTEQLDRLYEDSYGYLTDSLEWLEEEFEPDWVLFDLSQLEEHPEDSVEPPDTEPVFSNDRYALYRFESLLDG